MLLTLTASAFDSDAWLAKRSEMTAEATRLRAAYSNAVAGVVTPSEDLVIPLETDSSGKIRTKIAAGKAQLFLDRPLIWAENVALCRLDGDGKEEVRLDAERCVIDRVERSGWIEGHARLKQETSVVEGDGVHFSGSNDFVTVYSGADVVYSGLGRDGKDAKPSRIRARRADLDRAAGVILFEGEVDVDYAGEYKLNADRVFAFLKNTNTLSRIVASGGVAVVDGDRSGSCATAVYRDRERCIEMYGDGKEPARLADDSRRHADIRGRKITFWIDSEQVEVIAPEITLEEQDVR